VRAHRPGRGPALRVLNANPALWIGEWTFHASFLLVVLRHLRFFLDPVPQWVWWLQTPGLVGGYILPFALAYILGIRLLTKHEKYAAPANLFLITLVLLISSLGVIMHAWFKPNLVDVKLFALGILSLHPAAAPASLLFVLHVALALVLVPFLPTHIFTAPLVMMEARKREQALHLVIHEE
jgi:nitrate reductase gamma subunit